MSGSPYVHVIMPVGSDLFAMEKKKAIADGAARAGFEIRFPDYLPLKPTFKISELIAEILGADCVIADLSHERPSCYYELGIAEALGKRVYLVAKTGTPIHQSAARSMVRYYVDIADLAKSVEQVLKSEPRPHTVTPQPE
jgi:nucleoside 2-deoxyribosyltransferase